MVYLIENRRLRIWKLIWLYPQKKLQIHTIWIWLKWQMMMKPSLKKLRLVMRWKMILNNNEIPNHIKIKWTFILKNINTIEKIHKIYTKLWRDIYEVIQQLFYETDIFPDNFIKRCKNNANEARNIPLELKINIKRILMEQGLYAQVVMLRKKGLTITEANKD